MLPALVAALTLFVPLAQGDAAIDPGSLQTINKDGTVGVACPLKGTAVQAKIDGFGARVVVVQTFSNPSNKPIEAVYRFPLPENSAVDGMRMFVGQRMIEGVIRKKAEAKKEYDDAKKQGKTAALLDQERPNIFTQSVANIPAGGDIRVAITYVQVLKFEDGAFEFNYPMVVGYRFTGDTTPDPGKVNPPIVPKGTRSGSTIRLDVDIAAGAPITKLDSMLHKIDVTGDQPSGKAHVSLARANEIPNRDFILRYSTVANSVTGAFLTYADRSKGGFFTLIMMPPKAATAEQVAPKEAILVIDQSGSQEGLPIEKSKVLSKKAIDALNRNDTFNVVSFSDSYKVLWPFPRKNAKANRDLAKTYIDTLHANGGTQLEDALQAALQMPADPARPRIVLFNTDGFIGGEAEGLKKIEKYRGNSRIFTFGIGNSVNRYLIEAMSTEGRGASEIVTLNADVDAAVDRLVRRTDNPVLTDIDVQFEGVKVRDTLPRHIPDVFSESPVIVKGRYDKPGTGFVIVSGKLGGKPWRQQYPINFPKEGNSGSAIASLWAREKVNDLELQERLETMFNDGSAPQAHEGKFWEDQITNLALDFRIMTKYTSFVAVDRKITNPGGQQETINVPVDMADGVSYEGIFGASMNSKPDNRLAEAPQTPAYQAGDPLLTVRAPSNAQSVVAVFPDGSTKALAWNQISSRWEIRFDIPISFNEGIYQVKVYVIDAAGARTSLTVPFEVSTTAPELSPQATSLGDDLVRISVAANPRWARLMLFTPWNDKLALAYSAPDASIQLDVKLPKGFKGGWFRLIGYDRAHNQAEVKIYLSAKGAIEKIEPADK